MPCGADVFSGDRADADKKLEPSWTPADRLGLGPAQEVAFGNYADERPGRVHNWHATKSFLQHQPGSVKDGLVW
jgi:hypothetical protein